MERFIEKLEVKMLEELSKENIDSINEFDKEDRLKNFEEFFDNCLNS